MRLFGKVDGVVDRFDRAGWLSMPFDLAFQSTLAVYGPLRIAAAECYIPGAQAAQCYIPGPQAAECFIPGAVAAETP